MEQPGSESGLDSNRAAREARIAARQKRDRAITMSAAAALLLGLIIIGTVVMAKPGTNKKPTADTSSAAATPSVSAGPQGSSAATQPTAARSALAARATSAAPASPRATAAPAAPVTRQSGAARTGAFSVRDARRYLGVLAGQIGVRPGGSANEKAAADYIRAEVEAAGYSPAIESFKLPNGKTSQNVTAVLRGSTDRRIVLGAHYDTKKPAPGANDNGTGSAALMAIAKKLADETLPYTVEFVWFGTEEMIDSNGDHHHYGSRFHVTSLTASERARVDAMISVDMIGYGPEFRVRTMNVGPQGLRKKLVSFAKAKGLPAAFMRDSSTYGFSDHEPFELAGLPAAWIEWRDDPTYHSADDVIGHIEWDKVNTTGQLVLDFLRSLGPSDLKAFHAS